MLPSHIVAYAVRSNGVVFAERFATWNEAVEAAQEVYKLPANGDWVIVALRAGE